MTVRDPQSAVRGPQSAVPGGHVLRVLLLAVCATAVLPPAAAWWLNARRVAETTARVAEAVAHVRPVEVWPAGVTCGHGRVPDVSAETARARGSLVDTSVHDAWLAALGAAPGTGPVQLPTDAWGRCLLVTDGWVLSAGPNGIIETPRVADAARGDDIGARR